MSLGAAVDAVARARVDVERAREQKDQARQAYLAAAPEVEQEASAALVAASNAIESQRLTLEKREHALAQAEAVERTDAERRKLERIAALRDERSQLLPALRPAIGALLSRRRALAESVNAICAMVAVDGDRAAELRRLGEPAQAVELDVVRLLVGRLVEREASWEPARVDHLPAGLRQMCAALAVIVPSEFEGLLRAIQNEFVGLAGPSVSDFCGPQPAPLRSDLAPSAQRAARASALLQQLEALEPTP